MLASISHWGLHDLPETPKLALFLREQECRRNLAEAYRTGNDKYIYWTVSIDGHDYLDADFGTIEEAQNFVAEKLHDENCGLEKQDKYESWDCEFIRYWMDLEV